MRRITSPSALAAVFLLAACHSYKPQPLPVSAAGRSVRVQFSMPRTVVATRGTVSDSVLKLVSTVEGRVIAASGDTMNISLLRITDSAQDHEAPAGMTVTVVPDPSVAVDVLELDEAKTAALVVLPIYVIGSVAAVVAFAALLRSLEY